MDDSVQPEMRQRPISLLVVILLWVVGIPLTMGGCLMLYGLVEQRPDDSSLTALVAAAALAYLVIWPLTLYKAILARRRGQPLR